jgi:diguanylate cyclase (GGDEF)-like protein
MQRDSENVLGVFLHQSRRVIEKPSLREKLTAIAEAVVEAGLFKRVAVQLYSDQYGEKLFGWAGLTEEEQDWLASHDTLGPTEYERVREYGRNLGGNIYFVLHDDLYRVIDNPDSYLLASDVDWPGEGFWHPDDMLFAPLLSSGGSPLGNLTADEPFDGRVPTEATAALLAPFLAVASLLVDQDLERRRDPLTSCFNGPFFRNEVVQIAQNGELAGLFFLDMDNLKRTNDHNGHAAGDNLIRTTAQDLQQVVHDLLGRQGQVFRLHGDEFVVIVKTGPVTVANALKALYQNRNERLPNLSIGGAEHTSAEPLRELLARAEKAMYQDKWARKGGQAPQ